MDAIKISDTVYIIDGMTVAIPAGSVDQMNGAEVDAYLRALIEEAKTQNQ